MNERINKIMVTFDEMPIRTRLIITFAGIAIIFMLVELSWYSGNTAEREKISAEIQALDRQISDLTMSQQQLNAGIFNQRNSPQQRQLRQLDSQLEEVQAELEERALSLVKPEAMTDLLKEIIKNSAELKLISLIKQPPKPLFDAAESEQQNQGQVQMYRHPITLTFEGNYAETQKFLNQLENMKKQVNFESFDYSVDEYPKSTITLVVSTYSMSRKWIGG